MKGSLVKNPYDKHYLSKKKKFPSLSNTLLLNVYISNKIGDSFFN